MSGQRKITPSAGCGEVPFPAKGTKIGLTLASKPRYHRGVKGVALAAVSALAGALPLRVIPGGLFHAKKLTR